MNIKPTLILVPLMALLMSCTNLSSLPKKQVETVNMPTTTSPGQIKKHALAFNGILATTNQEPLSDLGTRPDYNLDKEKQLLADWWNIHSREDLLKTLDWLQTEGHRAGYALIWQILSRMPRENYMLLVQKAAEGKLAKEDPESLLIAISYLDARNLSKTRPIIAWDFARYIALCKWGTWAGYLSEQEAWDRIIPAARTLQASYNSWPDFADDYIRGRTYWSARQMREDGDNVRKSVGLLLIGIYRPAQNLSIPPKAGLWAECPWGESLGDGPRLEDLSGPPTARLDPKPQGIIRPVGPDGAAR